MKSSNPIWTIIKILIKIHLVIAGINTIFAYREERFEKGDLENGHIYRWKQGKIYYHRRGTGAPVLLIHGLDPSDSGRDLDTLSKALSARHTVYTIDLLGFGLSDKPWITYTNYLYVLLIQDFIKDVIGDITDVIAFEGSCLSLLQARKTDDSQMGRIVVVNPRYEENFNVPKILALRLKGLIDFPLYGTFIYNMYSLTCRKPLNRDGRHVFASRLTGHLESSVTGHEDLLDDEVKVIKTSGEDVVTYGDLGTALY